MQVQQQVVRGAVAVAGMVLASACDNGDMLSAPRAAAPSHATLPSFATAPATGPAPMLSAVAANVCTDVAGGTATAPAPGARIVAWVCHGGANQRFALQASGAVTAYDGALCLDVWGAQANDGDEVRAYTCHGGTNQKWTRTAAGELRTAVNGKCLDLWGAQAVNGARLVVWPCHGGANQKWTVNDAASGEVVAPVAASTGTVSTSTLGATVTLGSAELPRTTVDTRMPAPTGRTITVAAGSDLQGALNAAQPGDVITVAAGATFVGNFVLPAKAGMAAGQWITVRSSGTLPAEGTRVGPADAPQMPKLLTPNSGPALATSAGAQGWRLTGIEVGATAAVPMSYFLVAFGDGGSAQNSLAQVPSRLVLDRSYVHGSDRLEVRRCLALNSAASAVVDSYFGDCHGNQGDSQAIFGWNGPGPFKIQNNHLEGGHEVVFFGGPNPGIAGLIPSDIEVRRNHITRPMAWRGVWRAKNLFECKSCQRVLIEGNVLENNWIDAQNGFAVLLQGLSDENGAPQNRVWDVTIRNNTIRNTPQGINVLSRVAYDGGPLPLEPARRITVENNIVVLDASLNGGGRMVQILADPRDVTIAQNTFVDAKGAVSNSALSFDDGSNIGPAIGLKVVNNVFGPAQWSPVMGNGTAGALTTLAKFAPGTVLTGNVFVGGNSAQFPAGNFFPGTLAEAGLSGATAGSFQLTAQYASTPGASVAAVTTATRDVVR